MPTTAATFRERFRYRFDNFMARGGSSIFLSLVVIFIALLTGIVVLRNLLTWIYPEGALMWGDGFFRNAYITFLQMTDPGNMAQDIESSPLFKVSTVVAGFSGIVMLSSLIAFITTALDKKMNDLKKGHSKVIESDHTLILGWNERVTEILR